MGENKLRSNCRLCLSEGLTEVLRLASTPPANELVRKGDLSPQTEFPLGLWRCSYCGHVQLPVVVDPERLFRNYVYVSGTSPSFVDHFRRYADELVRRFEIAPGSLVVDVGSNDGTLLRFFKESGMRVLGVDPAVDIASRATESGIETIPEFLTNANACVISQRHGDASVVCANNVFAHADDLIGMALGVRDLMSPDGVFVFEVQYLADMCRKTLFDMVYHEHLSYHHVAPLVPFLESAGMRLFDVERVPTHGGSIRCYADLGVRPVSDRVSEIVESERSLGSELSDLRSRISDLKERLSRRLMDIRLAGKRIAGYGAPAKATTLMYEFGIGLDFLEYVVDDSPWKQGLLTPGKRVPVVSRSALSERPPDFLLVLAWNFAGPIMESCREFSESGGRFIVPLPELVER